ncbi:helix-turn-helix domain-containing protein, partial [Clostridium psychrophilum]|uniref:helix-turn-helix domain-containing protein n=1 Tax=Clostridium psychrophilum TaxID=132926 RepID=UPI001C0B8BC9
MPKSKHFNLSERFVIEHMIRDSFSFKAIAKELCHDCTSISKEIRHHIALKKTGAYGKTFNNCIHRFDCKYSYICDSPSCRNRYCRFCSRCTDICSNYKKYICPLTSKPPYV